MTDYSYSDVVSIKDLVIRGDKGNGLIWKKGWFFDDIISVDLQKLTADDSKKGILGAIHMDGNDGFFEKTNELHKYFYFLPDKNAEPEYVPFDLSDPEVRKSLRGKWIKSKVNNYELCIAAFHHQGHVGNTIPADLYMVEDIDAYELLEDWIFDDGSPVGNPANGQQMASK